MNYRVLKSTPLAIAIALLVSGFHAAASVPVADSFLEADESMGLETATDPAIGKRQYPSEKVMVDVYLRMVRENHVQPGVGLMAPNLTTELLQSVFDRAVLLGLADEIGTDQTDPKDAVDGVKLDLNP
jgi:hypothetical protein